MNTIKECKHHGVTPHRREGAAQHLRCIKCRSDRITKARHSLKKELVESLGGRCKKCGYRKSIWSLVFHHREAHMKSYAMGYLIRNRKREQAFEEAKKCDLLCSNCHGEIEEAKWVSG